MDGWMDVYMDGWMDVWMDGWMYGWMDVCMCIYVCVCACVIHIIQMNPQLLVHPLQLGRAARGLFLRLLADLTLGVQRTMGLSQGLQCFLGKW